MEPIVLDLGDQVREPGRQAELKLDALEKAYRLMPIGAIAVGERDLPYLAHLRASGLPLVGPGAPAAATRLEAAGVAVAATIGPSLRANFDAAGVSVAAEPRGADILLFHGSRDEARRLYGGRKDLLVVCAGHEEEYALPPERLAGGALLVSPGDKAKFVELVFLSRDPATGTLRADPAGAATPLGDRTADDPVVAKIVDEYKDRLFEENLVTAADRKRPETGGSYVGPETCSACHQKQYAVFEKTEHFHAFESLGPRKGTRDPECLRCHSTGFGYASGFAGAEATPDLARVSCETCHGVGSNHVRNPQAGFGAIKEPPKLCVECHDKENSPQFDFAKYWPRIRH